jgi:hypothetical protein
MDTSIRGKGSGYATWASDTRSYHQCSSDSAGHHSNGHGGAGSYVSFKFDIGKSAPLEKDTSSTNDANDTNDTDDTNGTSGKYDNGT